MILDGAVALIERQGPAALSMRRLGATLGVEGMAIYHHFAVAMSCSPRSATGRSGRCASLRAATIGGRRVGGSRRPCGISRSRDPATFQLLGLQPFDTPVSLEAVERLLDVLVAHGFGPAEALAIYRATVSYARGYALGEATGFTVDATRPAGRGRLVSLPASEFPILAGRARELATLDADVAFELGLQALLDWASPIRTSWFTAGSEEAARRRGKDPRSSELPG